MTREEAIHVLSCLREVMQIYKAQIQAQAIDMAIEALQEPSEHKLNNHCNSLLTDDSDDSKEQKSKLDLISRADAIGAVDSIKSTDNWQGAVIALLSALPSADAEQGWIPFKRRPLTDEEQQEYPDWAYIFDCLLPDDEEEILLSNGKHVWTDTFINDGECYLDGGDDIDEGMAWMPLPKPYREDGEA